MPIYGLRSEDTLLGPDGRPLTGVALELYANQADAEGRTNLLEAPPVTLGRWQSSDLPQPEVWARTPGGEVYQVVYPTSVGYVDEQVAGVRAEVATKASQAALDAGLAGKADATTTQAALDAKADRADFLGRLAAKADRSTVDLQLATKASTTDLQNAVAGLATLAQVNAKADATWVGTELAKRATSEDLAAAESRAAAKGTADAKSYVDGKGYLGAEHTAAPDPHPGRYVRGNVVAPVTFTNLLVNPSFESSGAGANGPGTAFWSAPNGSTIAQSQAVPAVDGAKVLAVTMPSGKGSAAVGTGYSITGLKGDTDYTFAIWAYVPTGVVDVNISVQGPAVGASTSGSRTSTKGKWVRLVHTFRTVSAGGQVAAYVLNAQSTTSAQTFYVDAAVLVEGAGAPAYFDGNTPGARWTGANGNSTSEKLLAGPGDTPAIAAQVARVATRYYEGAGSPEGVVQAPVGSRYIDVAATTGAVEWIKAANATAFGWRVAYGDTGWRDITSLLTTDWVPTATAPAFRLRRIMDTCYLEGRWSPAAATVGQSRGGARFLTNALPGGFTPGLYTAMGVVVLPGNMTGNIGNQSTRNRLTVSTGGASGTWVGTDAPSASATWSTDDAWPSTLP